MVFCFFFIPYTIALAKHKGGVDSSNTIKTNSRITSPSTKGSKRTRETNTIWSDDNI
jgi:hypothetical protein